MEEGGHLERAVTKTIEAVLRSGCGKRVPGDPSLGQKLVRPHPVVRVPPNVGQIYLHVPARAFEHVGSLGQLPTTPSAPTGCNNITVSE